MTGQAEVTNANGSGPIEFEDVPCMLCGLNESVKAGSVRWKDERRDTTLRYVLCRNCGLKYMTPRPTPAWYREFYRHEFWQGRLRNRNWRKGRVHWLPWKWHRRGLRGRLIKGRQRFEVFMPLAQKYLRLSSSSRVLDIGCGFGGLIHALGRKFGCETYGIEPGTVARDFASETRGITFIGKTAEDLVPLEGFDRFFDFVIMSNVLENIPDPRSILKAVRRVLKKDGILFVDSPNFYYYDSMNPYHPYIFSPETLPELFTQAGFEVKSVIFERSASHRSEPLRIKKFRRERFLTVLAKPGKSVAGLDKPIDAEAILAEQDSSLALLKRTFNAYKMTPKGLYESVLKVK